MSSIMSILSFSAITLFAATSNAHMILGSPPPYGSPDNSPLTADGSNFPCKATSNAGATVTEMSIGAEQPLSFIGSAVHGGGSCQISLTTDTPATKSSNWMVIHSIEGGCPAKGVAGNEAEGSSGGSNYTYSIPEGIAPGAYTLAWTWFNKIGNREMYMNCASIKVSGGSKKRATASFPAMFKANIPTTDCETVDSADVQFPDPGTSVDKFGTSALTPPTGPKCGSSSGSNSSTSAAGSSSSGSGSASSGAGSSGAASSGSSGSGSSGAGSSGAASSGSSGSGSSSGSNGAASAAPSVAASGAPAAAPADAAPPMAAASPAAASPVAVAQPSSGPSAMTNSSSGSTTPSTSSTGASTGTCSTAGQSICSPDGRQIGMCTTQLTVTWIPVASGTKCVGGYQVFAKRSSAKFQKGYVS